MSLEQYYKTLPVTQEESIGSLLWKYNSVNRRKMLGTEEALCK